ncbi:MAG: hypothetical protein Q8R39_01055 [bacterium]|nr:hypothetical protein [bacterium]
MLFKSTTALLVTLATLVALPLISALEAHVLNVTAQIWKCAHRAGEKTGIRTRVLAGGTRVVVFSCALGLFPLVVYKKTPAVLTRLEFFYVRSGFGALGSNIIR